MASSDKIIDKLFSSRNKPSIKEVEKVHNQVFRKTDCLACANCCKSAPPIITNSDVKRLSQFLMMTPQNFRHDYMLQDIDGSWMFMNVPCVFLDMKSNKCKVYDARPTACREYPHTTHQIYVDKELLKRNAEMCPAVENILADIEERFLKDE